MGLHTFYTKKILINDIISLWYEKLACIKFERYCTTNDLFDIKSNIRTNLKATAYF